MPETPYIRDLFSRISSSYDVMNDVMSLGLHRRWKRTLIHQLPLFEGAHVIDVAAGTGDISRLIQTHFGFLNITSHLIDLTPEMLEAGRKRFINHGIVRNVQRQQGAAEALPVADESMDIYIISFGLRNVADRAQSLGEAYRVLKKGGHFYCLEFSTPTHFKKAYDTYSSCVLPRLGHYIANDRAAYEYLVESIRQFPPATVLEDEIIQAQFQKTRYELWQGGIVALHYGYKA